MNTNNTSNPPFRIGEKVVYIDIVDGDCDAPPLKRGGIYTVCDLAFKKAWRIKDEKRWFIGVAEGGKEFYIAEDFAPIEENKERIRYVAVSETLREKAEEVVVESCNLS